jgi:hypothetical protein
MNSSAEQMPWAKKKTTTFHIEKKYAIPLIIFAVLLLIRIIAQPFIFKKLNEFLATFSPVYELHVDDLDISFIRGAYRFEGVSGKLKSNQHPFLDAKAIDVAISWKALFQGRVLSDINIDEMNLIYSKELLGKTDVERDKGDANEVKEALFPFKLASLDLKDSSIVLADYRGLKKDEALKLSEINGRVTNVTPQKDFPLSFMNLRANLLGSSPLKASGQFNTVAEPLSWNIDTEIHKFEMNHLNHILREELPLTFTSGTLDLYLEAKSEGGVIRGYAKPFVHNLDVMTSEKYKGIKHWFYEIVTAVGNLFLRRSDSKVVATRIPFTYDKEFKIETGEAISKAIENGWSKELAPGIEGKYEMKAGGKK